MAVVLDELLSAGGGKERFQIGGVGGNRTQHDAGQIPRLVAFHLEQGCGLAVASRWARGGSSPGAGFFRAIASRVGNVLVKLMTGARGVTDSATSFRSCGNEVAEFLSREKLPSEAHGFFAAMVPVVQAGGFLVSDFPIRFMPRTASGPRISAGDVLEFAASLPMTRRLVRRIRHDMRSNQVLWAQRNPRLRSQANSNGSTFGAIAELELLSESSRFLSWIVEVLEPQIGHRVLEVGAGLGAISIRLAEAGHLVTALEPADNVFLVARRAHDPKVTDSLTSLPPPPLHAQAKPSSGKGPLARLEPFGSGKDGGLYVSVGEQPGS